MYLESDISMRVCIYDVVNSAELNDSELASYLADIYHESANHKYPRVSE
ncbi:DUF7661 family protein [Photobacterium indicum]